MFLIFKRNIYINLARFFLLKLIKREIFLLIYPIFFNIYAHSDYLSE